MKTLPLILLTLLFLAIIWGSFYFSHSIYIKHPVSGTVLTVYSAILTCMLTKISKELAQ